MVKFKRVRIVCRRCGWKGRDAVHGLQTLLVMFYLSCQEVDTGMLIIVFKMFE
jgi:hypothetical protein